MKKLPVLCYALICICFFSSCRHNDHNISISYKDADRYYSMDADFNKSKSKALDAYLEDQLGHQTNVSFINKHKASVTLDDQTKFYVTKEPGHIFIKLNKEENSAASYHKIKSLCEGMKKLLIQ
jgi:hypothetical protein